MRSLLKQTGIIRIVCVMIMALLILSLAGCGGKDCQTDQ